MNKAFITIFCFLVLQGFSQQKNFYLKWTDTLQVGTLTKTHKIPSFQSEYFNYTGNVIRFQYQWRVSTSVDENSLEVKNLVSERMNPEELLTLPNRVVPSQLSPRLTYNRARGTGYATLSLNPIYKENGVLKKVISFQIIYREGSSKYQAQARRNIRKANSILASGNWYKFYVEKSGVYKIDHGFLKALGIDPGTVDPGKIKIYGNGGRMLPLELEDDYQQDIREIPILVEGGSDGSFDLDDALFFYGIGGDEWNEESQTHLNIFQDNAAYFLTVDGVNGKRIGQGTQPNTAPDEIVDSGDVYLFHEKDEVNIVKIGRRWFGERFSINSEQDFPFTVPNLNRAFPVRVGVKPAAVSGTVSSMNVTVNGQQTHTFNFPAVPVSATFEATQDPFSPDGTFFKKGLRYTDVVVNTDDITVHLSYNNGGNPSAEAYLDYISLEAKQKLTGYGEQFIFSYKEGGLQSGVVQFDFSGASSVKAIWDITDIYNVQAYTNTLSENTFSFKNNLGTVKKYLVVDNQDYYTPEIRSDKTVENQNLKGTLFGNGSNTPLDYLIICPEYLRSQAQKLADFHETNGGLQVVVASLEEIYNEFNSGNADIAAIRNFVRYAYDNAPNSNRKLSYLGLLGDGSFDYKDRISGNSNIIPVFHAFESFNLTFGIASDDFYGMMDNGEGTLLNNDLLDIAVGRMLANTPEQANDIVNKIIAYHSGDARGKWRNNLTLLSDDVDQSWEGIIQSSMDQQAALINTNKPFINIKKIYADAYQQTVSSGGERYEKAHDELLNSIEQGTIAINYFGHGGEDGLAQERLFTKEDAQSIGNELKYPLILTITCEFTRFDNPLRSTAGEFMYWNKNGGAIALVSTTREIFVGNGITYGNILSNYLFPGPGAENISIAEALRRAKVDPLFGGGAQKRVVFFFGDPALKLAIPDPQVRLTEINDTPITQTIDTLKALSKVKMEGEVNDVTGNLLPDFNGTVSVIVYDKEVSRSTLANDNTLGLDGNLIKLNYNTLGEAVFRGKASVLNGKFDFDFVVPRDIRIPVDRGRVSFYALNNGKTEDRTGYNTDILIGGINENAPEDNTGPEITLFMNNENFVSGGITNQSPVLIVNLTDQNGINTASGIGHDIIAILDGDESNPFVLNEFYETDVDDFTRGSLTYPLRNLEPGLHTLQVRAWDVYNNSSTEEIQFLVLDDGEIKLERVLNYPNPFTSYTEFWFNHNKPFEPLEVDLQVFTVSGKVIWNTSRTIVSNGFSRDIVWDGRDNFGDRIGKGVYVYKITVKSALTNKKTFKFEKLVIL